MADEINVTLGKYGKAIENLEDRVKTHEESNEKEFSEIRADLKAVINEALKRWPPSISLGLAALCSLCATLITLLFKR